MENKKAYLDLRTASPDNAYIMYYMNETIRAVQSLEEYLDMINQTFQVEHNELFKRFEANPNSTLYLASLIGELEYGLSDLRKMIDATRYSQMFNLAMQYLIEFTLNRFVQGYSRAYSQVALPEDIYSTSVWTALFSADATEAGIMLDPDHPRYEQVMAKHGVTTPDQISIKQKFKFAPKVFKQLWTNMKNRATSLGAGLKKLVRSKNFKEFKGRVKHSLKGVKHSMKGVKQKISKVTKFVTSSSNRKFFVKNYKLGWSEGGMMVLGMIGDAIQTFLMMKEWGKVAGEMRKAREQYTEYRDNLKKELANINTQTTELTGEWPEIIETFKHLSLSFKSLIDNATEYAEFNDVIGLPKLSVDINSPLFSLNFNTLTKSTLNSAQATVIGFMKEADNDMNRVADQLRARTILYENVQTMSAGGQSVQHILDSSHNIYSFSASQTIKDYGKLLRKKDIVCTVSQLRKTKTVYDAYQLDPFRPRCDVTAADFQKMQAAAATARAASAAVEGVLNMCMLYNMCPCPALIAQMNGVSESVVIDLIRTLRPNMSQYCGMTGCQCVVL